MLLLRTLLLAPSFIVSPPAPKASSGRAPSMCELPSPESMRVKELKAELDDRGVAWRGVCIEQEDLVNAVTAARADSSPAPPPPAPASPPPEVEVMQGGRADSFASSVLEEVRHAATPSTPLR